MIKNIRTSNSIKKIEGFYVYINFIYGNTDSYCTRSFGPFFEYEKEYLMEFLNMLDKCLAAYPNGRDYYTDKIPEVKIWEGWIDGLSDKKNIISRISFSWEKCPNELDTDALIKSYCFKFYNKKENLYHEVKCDIN